jgi:DNA primase
VEPLPDSALKRQLLGELARQAPDCLRPSCAVRMLLQHSDWWDQLTADDHHLLHQLPGEHGALVAWLERHLVDHGPQAWSFLQEALAEDPLNVMSARLMKAMAAEDTHSAEELRQVMNRLWIEHLELEAKDLAANASDPEVMARFKEVREQIRLLRLAGVPV